MLKFSQGPREVIHRIDDDVFGDDEDLSDFSNDNGETSSNDVKVYDAFSMHMVV